MRPGRDHAARAQVADLKQQGRLSMPDVISPKVSFEISPI
jgi:hypothetical protein